MVVVQAPYAMRACRLKVVRTLDPAKKLYISRKHAETNGREYGFGEEREAVETQKPDQKIKLVSRAVVDASAITKGMMKIGRCFYYPAVG